MTFGRKVTLHPYRLAVRDEDKTSFYHNSNYYQSAKKNFIDDTVHPPHFKNVETVVKGV